MEKKLLSILFIFSLFFLNPMDGFGQCSDTNAPAVEITSSATVICAGESVNFTATPQNVGPTHTFQWRVNGVNRSGETGTSFNVSNLQNGSVITVVMNPNCAGTTAVTSNSISIQVKAIPNTPTITGDNSVCVGDAIVLSASAITGATYIWTGPNNYTNTGKDITITGATTSMAGTYQVTATINGCTGSAGYITVNINPIPGAPTAGNKGAVCVGGSLELTANTITDATYSWTGPNGFNSSAQNPIINNVTQAMQGIYSVTATLNECTSPAGTTDVVIKVAPAAPTAGNGGAVCVGSTIELTASNITGASYSWTGPGGFTSTEQNPTRTGATTAMAGTYSVTATVDDCSSSTATTNVMVNTIPTAPTASSNAPVCVGETITLTATTISGAIYSWTGPDGFTSSQQNPTLSGATLAMAGDYKVTATVNDCVSSESTTTLVVNEIPAITATTPGERCGSGAVNLSATASAGTINWYSAATGGSSLGTGTSLTTPSISSTTSYYVDATANGCTTGTRTEVVATIKDIPTITETTPGNVCTSGTVTLSATASAGTINWYASETGGSSLATGNSFTTPNLSTTTTYYVDATADGCTTTSRTAVVATVTTIPEITSTTPGSRCNNGTVNLSATTSAGTVTWYATNSSTTPLANGVSYSPNITATTTFYVAAVLDGCSSTRTAVIATKYTTVPFTGNGNNAESKPTGPTSICPSATGLKFLIPNNMIQDAENYVWHLPSGFNITAGEGTKEITVSVPGQGAVVGNNEISVTAYNPCGNSGKSRALVVNVGSFAAVDAGPDISYCIGTSIELTNTLSGNATNVTWEKISGPGEIAGGPYGTTPFTFTSNIIGTTVLRVTTNTPVGSGCPNTPGTDEVTITINEASVAPTSISSNATICNGTPITLTQAGGSLGTGASWKWYSDSAFTTLIGTSTAADASLTISPTETTTYYLRAETISGLPCPANVQAPGNVTVTVNQASVAPSSTSASTSTICKGESTILTQTGGVLGSNAVWKWYSDAGFTIAVTGTVSNDGGITVSPTVTTTYYLRAENTTAPCAVDVPATGSVTVTVNDPSTAPTSLTALNPIICNGTSTSLSQLGGNLGTGATWNWYSDADFTILVGTTTDANATLNVNPTSTTTYYLRAESTSPPCEANVAATGSVTVTVNEPSVAPASLETSTATICNGENASLSQTGGSLGTDAVWKWYSDSSYTTPVNGAVGEEGNITVSPTVTTTYYLRVENTTAPCTSIAEGPAVGVTVTVNNPSVAPQELTVSVSEICNGNNTTLSLGQTGGSLGTGGTWKWYSDATYTTPVTGTVDGNGNLTISPAITTTYYLRAQNTADPCTANAEGPGAGITVTVNDPPVIVQDLEYTEPVSVCAGFPVNFTVEATGTELTYEWFKDNMSTGIIIPSLDIAQVTASDAGIYKVLIKGTAPCTSIESKTVELIVNQTLTISSQPEPTIPVCLGENSISIGVVATGDIYDYVWRKDGIPVSDDSKYEGSSTATLIIKDLVGNDSGSFDVVISSPEGSCSQIISSPSVVTVYDPPTVEAGPDLEVCSNETSITLSGATATNHTSLVWTTTAGGQISNATELTGATYSPVAADYGNTLTFTLTAILEVDGIQLCADAVDTKEITIIPQPELSAFSYTSTSTDTATEFCETDTAVKNPTIQGNHIAPTNGTGVFTVDKPELVVNSSDGTFTPNGTPPGVYVITYTFNATSTTAVCTELSRDFTVTIGANPVATFEYDITIYCRDTRDNTFNTAPILSFTEDGHENADSFTVDNSGLVFDAATGAIDLSGSSAGTYKITRTIDYTGAGEDGCQPVSADFTITIINRPIPDFTYSETSYCSDPAATLSIDPVWDANAIKGIFSYTSTVTGANLVMDSDGKINITTSDEGIFTITNTLDTEGDGCDSVSKDFTITIDKLPEAVFSYSGISPDKSFCISNLGATLETSPDTGGTYSISGPSALVTVNSSTGVLSWTAAEAVPGTYTVTYTIPAGTVCDEVAHSETISIDALPVGGVLNFTGVGRVLTTCENAVDGYAAPLVLTDETGLVMEWQYKTATSSTWTIYNSQDNQLSRDEVEDLVNNTSTVIRAKISNGACNTGTYSATAIVSVIPSDIKPSPVKAEPTIVCFGTAISLSSKTGYGESFGKFEGGDFTSAGIKNNGWNFTDPDGNEIPFDANANSGTPIHWHKTQPKWKFETAVINSPYTLTDMWWNPLSDGKQNEHFAITQGAFSSNMDTPAFTLTGMDEAKITFDQAYNLTTGATIRVVLLKNGVEYKELDKITGPASSGNYEGFGSGTPNVNDMSYDLGSYLGEANLKVRFEYTGVRRGDVWAVDNIKVPEGPQGVLLQWFYDDNPDDSAIEQIGQDNQEVVSFTPRKIGWNDFEVKTALLLDSNGNACESLDNFERVRVFVFDTYETTVAVTTGTCGSYSATLDASLNGALQGPLEATDITFDGYKGEWKVVGPVGVNYTLTKQNEDSGLDLNNDPNVIFTSDSDADFTITWELKPTAVYPDDYSVVELRGELVENPACPPVSAPVTPDFTDCTTLDFDGDDDVIVINDPFTGVKAIEAWIRPEEIGGTIISGPSFEIKTPTSGVTANGRWYHLAVIFDDGDANLSTEGLYIDGIKLGNAPTGNGGGTRTSIGAKWTSAESEATNHFSGWIEEVRIWKNSPTLKEIRFMMNQRLKLNGEGPDAKVVTPLEGEIVPNKPVAGSYYTANGYNLDEVGDAFYNQTAADLFAYYRLISDVPDPTLGIIANTYKPVDGSTPDLSLSGIPGRLFNMTTDQQNTSPTPYFSTNDGPWAAENAWARPAVWDPPHTGDIEWNIARISNNITSGNKNIIVLGLISDTENKLLEIYNPSGGEKDENNSGQSLTITHYLELDGNIDLIGESQLLQDHGSILAESSKGYLERDQQGKQNSFVYNYWSSPVSLQGSTPNNAAYTIKQVLMDGTDATDPKTINFQPDYWAADGPITLTNVTISSYWLWGFSPATANVYAEWDHIREGKNLNSGEGFTMKGTAGNVGIDATQNYTFRGKPHNGDIILPQLAPNQNYLIGNPYPSAMDSHEFIENNLQLVNGTLYFWDHFIIVDHILLHYVGGYATLTKTGSVPAASIDDRIDNSDPFYNRDNIKTPGRFIPVGQGFMINSTGSQATGNIKFKNSQRIYETEGVESIFLKPEVVEKTGKAKSSDFKKIRLSFSSPVGYWRQILVGEVPGTTDGFDLGYDANLFDNNVEDMYWMQDNNYLVIQAVPDFNKDRILPLGLKIKEEKEFTIRIDTVENAPASLNIFLNDKLNDSIHDLRKSAYVSTSEPGTIHDRFEIIFFKDEPLPPVTEVPGEDPDEIKAEFGISIRHGQTDRELLILNPHELSITNMYIFDLNGNKLEGHSNLPGDKEFKMPVRNYSSGVYIVQIVVEGRVVSKKIIISN